MLLRPILEPLFQPVLTQVGSAPVGVFNPLWLFRDTAPGFHLHVDAGMRRNVAVGYDPAQCVLFQDSAATTPVTAEGQFIGYIKDTSGRGNHFYSPSGGSTRPALRIDENSRYYAADAYGFDDWWESVNTLNMSITDAVTLVAAVRKDSDAAAAVLFELSPTTSSNTGALQMRAPQINSTSNFHFASKGTLEVGVAATGYPAPYKAVLTGLGRISTDTAILRVNGTQVASSSSDQGSGNYGNYKAYFFRRGGSSLPFKGRFYGATLLGRTATATELLRIERWHNSVLKAY